MRPILAVFLVLGIAGCSVGPNYQRPETSPPEAWQQADTTMAIDSAAVAAADTGWWTMFGDTVLTELIQTALTQNNDVRIAAARVEQFMGLYGATKSDFFPKIGAEAVGSRGQRVLDGNRPRATTNLFYVDLAATWEIDLWGKIRRATEAANANLLAAEESRRAVVMSTVALVANAYIDLLSLDTQLDIAKRTVESRAKALDLFRQRYDKGDVSELELSQVESQYWLARSQVPFLEMTIVRIENAISVLVGRNPGPIPRGGVLDSLRLPVIPAGLPSDVLERRPDVRAAEEGLVAANASIGVAKSYYFPSISLTGLFGFGSNDLSKLFVPEARIWNVGVDILAPIFRWGEISGQVEAAEAVQRQALESYVLAVRNAFADAEDALVERSRTEEQRYAQENQVRALNTYYELAQMRYWEGVTSYLEVLDAERSLFNTELEFAQTQGRLYQSVVGVYRALGGGWVDRAADAAYQPADPVDPER